MEILSIIFKYGLWWRTYFKNIDVPVAHKIGDAYDFEHDVAIVYADSFILSILRTKRAMTKSPQLQMMFMECK